MSPYVFLITYYKSPNKHSCVIYFNNKIMKCIVFCYHMEKVVVKGNEKKKSRHITESSDSQACALPCLKCFCICNLKTQDTQKEKFQKGVQNQSCVLDVWLSYYMTIYIKPRIQTKLCAGRYLW